MITVLETLLAFAVVSIVLSLLGLDSRFALLFGAAGAHHGGVLFAAAEEGAEIGLSVALGAVDAGVLHLVSHLVS